MIKLENVNISYDNKEILKNFSYDFADNSMIAIVGRSGCGKSTLLKTIAGLIKPNKGKAFYNDIVIKKPIKDICMMHQTYSNFPWKTCLENVLFPVKNNGKITNEQKKEATELLKRVGLEDYIDKYPHELSGGMKQRLALARTLMIKPKVILMDEPLSALDDKTRSDMQNLILQLHYNTKNTVIMVTHNLDEAEKMCNQIINL